jgi:SAM-dependent methyltransferase
MMEFDADAASRVEAAYATPDIVAQRDRIRDALALEPGEQVLDVGVGPGFLAAEMAAEVGPDGRVCGIDTSAAMLEVAARRNPVCTRRRRPGGRLLGLVATFVVDRGGLTSEEVEAWAASMRALGEDWFFSLNRYVFLASRP